MIKKIASSALVCLTGLSFSSCVDNDYDLSKDIDMNITVGGNITLPPSSTDRYTLAQILDLDNSSSIKPDGHLYGLAKDDYVLVQDGNVSPTTFSIAEVTISDVDSDNSNTELLFIGTGSATDQLLATVQNLTNTIELSDDNVDPQIISVKEAEGDIDFSFRLHFQSTDGYNGNLTIKQGFTISFPKEWTIENHTTGDFTEFRANNVLTFTRDYVQTVGQSLDLKFKVTKIDVSTASEGQGIYAPGHFRLDGQIVSNGNVTMANGTLGAGRASLINVLTEPIVQDAVLTSFTGIVNPDIKIDPTSFVINDVPGFLKEPGNNLDIDNPSINLTIHNTSPAEAEINALLKSVFSNGEAPVEVWIGSEHGTDPIIVAGNSTTVLSLSRKGTGAPAGGVNIKVPELGNLIASIPDRIEMSNIDAQVPQDKYYKFNLGRSYDFSVNYQVVVPLAFGKDLKFTYSTVDDGWDDDLEKYNFREILATVTVSNTAPLNMVPTVHGIDRHGNVLTDITAEVEGVVAAGTLSSPTESELKITIRSTGSNIGDLDGVELLFDATSDTRFVGTPLNAAQALKFTNIVLKLIGGIDIDLN